MPSSKDQIEVIPLHATFTAEVRGVDFSKPIPDHIFAQVKDAIEKV